MPDNPHPAWKQTRCRWCAAGELFRGGCRTGTVHRLDAGPSDFQYVPCTAPTEAEYIAELEGELASMRVASIPGRQHSDDAWRKRVAGLEQQNARLRAAVQNQCGDNLCHLTERDIAELKLDPARIPPWSEFGESCRRFHAQVSGQVGELGGGMTCMTIAQLEQSIVDQDAAIAEAHALVEKWMPENSIHAKALVLSVLKQAGADYCETDDVAEALREEDEHA